MLRIARASFAYREDVVVLREVTLDFRSGFTAIVGPNGSGKTTLLRLLSGDLSPTEGSVHNDLVTAVCPQEVEDYDETFATRDDGLARSLRDRLRLDVVQLARWSTLSPGERKRWQIGGALAREPEVLLLDEPTNHIDAEAAALLRDALARFRGIGVIVTHDRALLAALPRAFVRVDRGDVTTWRGSFEDVRAAWAFERDARQREYDEAIDQKRASKRALDQLRRTHESAERNRSTGARMRNRYDSDARGIGGDFRAARAEAHIGRAVARARDKIETIELPDKPARELGGELFIGFTRPARTLLFSGSINIRRDDRIQLIGPNGCGKTTLLRAIVAGANARVGYLPQELSPREMLATIDDVKALDRAQRGRVLSLLAALGVDPARVLATSRPSPGEARKLAIAKLLGTHVELLALDEPTNHLDLPAVERLESALAHYPGTLVLVTHDDAFAEAAKVTLRVAPGELHPRGSATATSHRPTP